MELSDAQFEHIVGLLAENRVALQGLKNEIEIDRKTDAARLEGIAKNLVVLQSSIDCLEPELNKLHTAVRTQAVTLSEHTQALDGVVQLAKSSYDIVESINLRQLEESKRRAPSADVERHTQ